MALFDQYISSIIDYIGNLRRNNRQVRELHADRTTSLSAIIGGGPSIVLKADTFLELGGPEAGSCAITMYTNNVNLLKDSRITLIGPDVNETQLALLPFGQVILVGGEHLNDHDYYKLVQYQNVSDLFRGYMIKSAKEDIWSRLSNEAADRGFNFVRLGTELMMRIKAEQPKIQAIEVLYVTSNKEDVLELRKIASSISTLSRKIKERVWSDRGIDIYECNPGGHCGACADKTICNEIKKIGSERSKTFS